MTTATTVAKQEKDKIQSDKPVLSTVALPKANLEDASQRLADLTARHEQQIEELMQQQVSNNNQTMQRPV